MTYRRSVSRRGLRLASAAIVVAVVALVGVFLVGVEISGEFLREPLERALTTAFKVPARIEGPLRLRTGLGATVSADALVLADPSGAAGAAIARAVEPSARVDLLALLRREVVIEEAAGARLELALARDAGGRANWAPLFAARPAGRKPALTFEGIERLRIGTVAGGYRREDGDLVPFALTGVEAALPRHRATSARGSVQTAGQQVSFDLRGAPLAELFAPGAVYPLQGTARWAGVTAAIDGSLARDGWRLDAGIEAAADDAGPALAALGIAAARPGRLTLRLRLGIAAAEISARDLALTLGNSVVSGSAGAAWTEGRRRFTVDLVGERVDLAPFAPAKPMPAADAPKALVGFLDRAAAGADAQVRLAVGELDGLPVTSRELKFEGRSGDGLVGGSGSVVLAGTRADLRLDYDARKPRRSLAAEISGGSVASARLGGAGLPRELSGSAGGIRGQLRAQGETARAVVAAVDATLEARDLRWTVETQRGPLGGRFDHLRVAVRATRASTAEVSGKLGGGACSLRVAGGALAPLLDGEPWPLRITGSCPNARLGANGRVARVRGRVVGEVEFDAAADRVGPLAQALGIDSALPGPVAARGTLVLDEQFARARFAALRFGGSRGAGQVAWPLDAGAAARVQLALDTLDLDELAALAGRAPPKAAAPAGPARPDARLPDVEFTLAADRIALAGAGLRRLQVAGAVRARRLPPAAFRLEWEGVPVSGRFGADFSGASPSVELDAGASNADLSAVVAALGVEQATLRAASVSLQARAKGASPGEMLAGATVGAAIEGGRLDFRRGGRAGASGGEFSARLAVAPGRPARLSARGAIDGEPMELDLDASLAGLARDEAAGPLSLRLRLGDAQAEASGTFSRDGTGAGRLRVAGGRLDRLGRLIGASLPQEGPYSASASVTVSADAIRADDLAAQVGSSRVTGEARVERRRGGRPKYVARLRAPSVHLDDLGIDRWLHADEGAAETPPAGAGGHGLEVLRAADLDATVDVEAMLGEGERIANGRLRVVVDAGVLRAQLRGAQPQGGRLDAELGIDANAAPPKLALRASARGLEYGPLARSLDRETAMVGTLDLDADLAARWPQANLPRTLAGTVDLAIYPRGLGSRALALWGVGFVPAMLNQLDPNERSAVACAVGSFDVAAGVARSAALFVDASRVRVVGEVEVELASRALSGRIDPRSKDPALLTLAPTMLLGGTVDQPRLRSAPENIVTVPLRLGASVADFARGWLGALGRSGDGEPGCRDAFEQIRQARSPAK